MTPTDRAALLRALTTGYRPTYYVATDATPLGLYAPRPINAGLYRYPSPGAYVDAMAASLFGDTTAEHRARQGHRLIYTNAIRGWDVEIWRLEAPRALAAAARLLLHQHPAAAALARRPDLLPVYDDADPYVGAMLDDWADHRSPRRWGGANAWGFAVAAAARRW